MFRNDVLHNAFLITLTMEMAFLRVTDFFNDTLVRGHFSLEMTPKLVHREKTVRFGKILRFVNNL